MLALIYFIILAVIALGAAVCVFLSRHPLYGALSLVTSMVALAGIYGLIGSPFLGVVQIMVYAGAIMMLVTFVIMVLNGARFQDADVRQGFVLCHPGCPRARRPGGLRPRGCSARL